MTIPVDVVCNKGEVKT